jgi:hypothetical protein
MTIYEWMKNTDLGGMQGIIWSAEDKEDEEPLYQGPITNIPIWLADYKLASKKTLKDNHIDVFAPINFVWTEDGHKPAIQFILED